MGWVFILGSWWAVVVGTKDSSTFILNLFFLEDFTAMTQPE
jgi:hypothetical protein